MKLSSYRGLGILLMIWLLWSFGANGYEYICFKEWKHLIFSTIVNISTFFYIGHTIFFPEKNKNIWHMGTVFLLIYFYVHLIEWMLVKNRIIDYISATINGYVLFYLGISLIRDMIKFFKSAN